MGTTVIGGMMAASLIGIFLVPAIFYMVERVSGGGVREQPQKGTARLSAQPLPGDGD